MEIEAIRIGLDLLYFWQITPNQFKKCVTVYKEKEKNRVIEQDFLNHILGKYISFAFNDPKKYPRKNFLSKDLELVDMTDEEMEEMAKRNVRMMGGVINDNR